LSLTANQSEAASQTFPTGVSTIFGYYYEFFPDLGWKEEGSINWIKAMGPCLSLWQRRPVQAREIAQASVLQWSVVLRQTNAEHIQRQQ